MLPKVAYEGQATTIEGLGVSIEMRYLFTTVAPCRPQLASNDCTTRHEARRSQYAITPCRIVRTHVNKFCPVHEPKFWALSLALVGDTKFTFLRGSTYYAVLGPLMVHRNMASVSMVIAHNYPLRK